MAVDTGVDFATRLSSAPVNRNPDPPAAVRTPGPAISVVPCSTSVCEVAAASITARPEDKYRVLLSVVLAPPGQKLLAGSRSRAKIQRTLELRYKSRPRLHVLPPIGRLRYRKFLQPLHLAGCGQLLPAFMRLLLRFRDFAFCFTLCAIGCAPRSPFPILLVGIADQMHHLRCPRQNRRAYRHL